MNRPELRRLANALLDALEEGDDGAVRSLLFSIAGQYIGVAFLAGLLLAAVFKPSASQAIENLGLAVGWGVGIWLAITVGVIFLVIAWWLFRTLWFVFLAIGLAAGANYFFGSWGLALGLCAGALVTWASAAWDDHRTAKRTSSASEHPPQG
jgi:hypothetical protein